MKLPHKKLERKLLRNGYQHIYAIDEVGMGCLAGPVVVCAIMLDHKFLQKSHSELQGVRDSKLLSANQREELAGRLTNTADLKYKITFANSKTIDKFNIYQASRVAMRRSIKKLVVSSKLNTRYLIPDTEVMVLVDGNKKIRGLNLPQLAITKGDSKVFAIACASIIAKVFRDKMMVNYDKKYPGYDFARHKGYGTKLHQVRLASLGPSPIHRRSFAPVSKLL